MSGLQRAQMAIEHRLSEHIVAGTGPDREPSAHQHDAQNQAGRESDPVPPRGPWRCRRLAQSGIDTHPEPRRRLAIKSSAVYGGSQRLLILYETRACMATCEMLLDIDAMHQVEFTIDIPGKKSTRIFAVHATPPCARGPARAFSSRERARASLDITVPRGTPVMAPISL